MNELSSLRTETGKIFELDPELGRGQYALETRTGPIHYKESYQDTDPWLDLDETYSEPSEIKGIGKVLVYPKLPNIVTVYQDRCGYQIQSRSNPDHIAKVELVGIDGQEVTARQDTTALKTYARVHPYRVGIWKDFSSASKAKSTTMRWKITEQGRPDKDSHPFFFRENPEAFTTAGLTDLSPAALDAAKVSISTARTRISDASWYWDELVPPEVKLVDTDYQVGADADDAWWYYNGSSWQLDTTNPVLHLGTEYINSASRSANVVTRFTSIAIPKAVLILSAAMMYCAYSSESNDTVNTSLYLNAADNATFPASGSDANSKTLTSAYTAWNAIAHWIGSTWYTSPNMSSPVQEVINRSGWSSGNALMVMHKDNGTTASTSGTSYRRLIKDYKTSTSSTPKLSITWTYRPKSRGVYVPDVSWLSKSLLKRREI